MAETELDAQEFLGKLEEKFGGKIGRKTFSLWYGDSEGNIREFGVFIYRINGIFHYEDFEREPRLLGFKLYQRNPVKYVKFERSFDPQTITEIKEVKKKDARAFIQGKKEPKKASALARFFSDTVSMVSFEDGTVKFFQLADKDFFN